MAEAGAKFSIGQVIQRTFGAIGRNFVTFFVLAIVLGGVPAVISQFIAGSFSEAAMMGEMGADVWIPYIGSMLLSLAAGYVLLGALTHGAIVDLNGRRPSIGECLSTGVRHVLPLIALAILTGFGVFLGLLLLIIPGIFLALMWSVAAPAYVVERPGIIAAFGRSAELTKNHRWAILGLFVIYFIVAFVIGIVMAIPMGLAAAADPMAAATNPVSLVLLLLLSALTTMIGTVGAASLYYELRTIKDGVGADALASVFE
jgi:hypothetical protein